MLWIALTALAVALVAARVESRQVQSLVRQQHALWYKIKSERK